MIDYEEMTNIELDTQAVERFNIEHWNTGTALMFNSPSQGHNVRWQPTDPDSNQVERYLFKILNEKLIRIFTDNEERWFEIKFVKMDDYYNNICDVKIHIKSPGDMVNRIKVIACLKVWDKLNA